MTYLQCAGEKVLWMHVKWRQSRLRLSSVLPFSFKKEQKAMTLLKGISLDVAWIFLTLSFCGHKIHTRPPWTLGKRTPGL